MYKFSLEDLFDSMPPARRRNSERRMQAFRIQMRLAKLFRWGRWPILNVIWVFWSSIFDEGIYSTVKPRWGAMTFSYLNDGIRPTLYHTILSILNPQTPIYPKGAPRNSKEK